MLVWVKAPLIYFPIYMLTFHISVEKKINIISNWKFLPIFCFCNATYYTFAGKLPNYTLCIHSLQNCYLLVQSLMDAGIRFPGSQELRQLRVKSASMQPQLCHTLGLPGLSLLAEMPRPRGLHFLFQAAPSPSLCWAVLAFASLCLAQEGNKTKKIVIDIQTSLLTKAWISCTLGHIPPMFSLKNLRQVD